jgi:thiamine biosynthesis protein ThiS
MKKIKKIKIKINGKITSIVEELTLDKLIRNLKIPLSKVAIELNKEIVNKKILTKLNYITKMLLRLCIL